MGLPLWARGQQTDSYMNVCRATNVSSALLERVIIGVELSESGEVLGWRLLRTGVSPDAGK